MKDSWLPLRLIILADFALLCGLLAYFLVDFSDVLKIWINAILLTGAIGFALASIFLRPIPGRGGLTSFRSNKIFGVLSVLLVLALFVINPYDLMHLTLNMRWRTYLFVLGWLTLAGLLIIAYIEMLWALAAFQEDRAPDEDPNTHKLRKINMWHYLLFLPALLSLCALFIIVASVFTTYFTFTSYPAYLHSLAAGSVYPFFIVGVLCMGVLLILTAVMYGYYRFIRAEPEGFDLEDDSEEEDED